MAKLDKLQWLIMRVLWAKEEATVLEIQEALKNHKKLAPTTIGTVLSRLRKKGIVTYRTVGRQYVYRPLITESDTKSSMVSSLVDQLFQGNSSQLVNFLVNEQALTQEELEKLKNLIEQQKSKK